MNQALDSLPLTNTITPESVDEAARTVRQAAGDGLPIYPLGGGTSLDFGLPAKVPGLGLSLAGLNRVIDYPARDMTITVESGITLAQLQQTLATERQRLPIDAPHLETATLGGLIATNFSGPRRYGQGTLRDYVIGISAIDGRGVPFQGGGRVVKNVAGYDFCKLLIGSLGTLAVITQVTLKVKPIPEASGWLLAPLSGSDQAEQLLAALVHSATTPTAVELLAGSSWQSDPATLELKSSWCLAVGLEGTSAEVDYMFAQLQREWQTHGVRGQQLPADRTADLWQRLTNFPAQQPGLVIQASMVPSAVAAFTNKVLTLASDATVLAHAGSGVVIARFPTLPPADVSRLLIRELQPAAQQSSGSLVVLSAPAGAELTRQTVWGGASPADRLMRSIKEQFDPAGVLNPGRFLY